MKNPYLPFFGHEFKQKKREKAKREREREDSPCLSTRLHLLSLVQERMFLFRLWDGFMC
jgi:hypothetical protein